MFSDLCSVYKTLNGLNPIIEVSARINTRIKKRLSKRDSRTLLKRNETLAKNEPVMYSLIKYANLDCATHSNGYCVMFYGLFCHLMSISVVLKLRSQGSASPILGVLKNFNKFLIVFYF